MKRLCLSLLLAIASLTTLAATKARDDNFTDGVELYSEGNYSAAAEAFQKSADKGNPEAQFNLGLMYLNGQGVAQDYQQALSLLTKLAEQGNARAQVNLARMYAKGKGVVANYGKAIPWFTKAADQGYADAQYSLGLLYVSGTGTQRDYRLARELLQKAADQNNASAQYQLGLIYFKGKGVAVNMVEALKWIILAGDYDEAVSYRRYAESRMSQDQISEAKNLADEWVPSQTENP